MSTDPQKTDALGTDAREIGHPQTDPAPSPRRTGTDDLAALCQQVASLAATLPQPLGQVRLTLGDTSVEVGWHDPSAAEAAHAAPPAAAGQAHRSLSVAHGGGAHLSAAPVPGTHDGGVPDGCHHVTAPLVGTFYAAPSPGAAPFVTVGEVVEVGQRLGIVEAMKLMNPIVADVSGEVLEVLVADGQPVEFDQPLVRVATEVDAAALAQAG